MDFIRTSRPLIAGSVAALSLGASAQAQAARTAPRKDKRPDVIFILTDQQTARAMSCAGNPWLSTPNMDALAADGVRFDRAYCPFPLGEPELTADKLVTVLIHIDQRGSGKIADL